MSSAAPSGQVLRNQPFDDHEIGPAAVQLSMLLVNAHVAEAMLAAERPIDLIEEEDPLCLPRRPPAPC